MTVSTTSDKGKKYTRNPSPLAQCIKACEGHLPAAILLYQITYRFKAEDALWEERDHHWITQPRACWMQETGLTPKQIRSALDQLEKLELIKRGRTKVVRDHQHMTGMLRLTDKGANHTAHMGTINVRPHGPDGHSGTPPTCPDGHSAPRPLCPDGHIKENTYPGENVDRRDFAPEGAKTHSRQHQEETSREDKDVVEKGKIGSKPKVKKANPNDGPRKTIEAVWKRGLIASGKPAAGFVGPDWKHAQDFIDAVGEDAASKAAEIAALFWPKFVGEAEKASHLFAKAIPKEPNFRFLAMHPQAALQFAHDYAPVPVEPKYVTIPDDWEQDPATYLRDNPPMEVRYEEDGTDWCGQIDVPLTPELRKLIDPALLTLKMTPKKACSNFEDDAEWISM